MDNNIITREDVYNHIKTYIEDITNITVDSEDMEFFELGMFDSLDYLDLIMNVEDKFNIQLPDGVENSNTIRGFINQVMSVINK